MERGWQKRFFSTDPSSLPAPTPPTEHLLKRVGKKLLSKSKLIALAAAGLAVYYDSWVAKDVNRQRELRLLDVFTRGSCPVPPWTPLLKREELKEHLTHVLYPNATDPYFPVIYGEPGSGKTTLIQDALMDSVAEETTFTKAYRRGIRIQEIDKTLDRLEDITWEAFEEAAEGEEEYDDLDRVVKQPLLDAVESIQLGECSWDKNLPRRGRLPGAIYVPVPLDARWFWSAVAQAIDYPPYEEPYLSYTDRILTDVATKMGKAWASFQQQTQSQTSPLAAPTETPQQQQQQQQQEPQKQQEQEEQGIPLGFEDVGPVLLRAAEYYREKESKPAVLVVDNFDYIAQQDPKLFTQLLDLAKDCAEKTTMKIAFVINNYATLRKVMASSAWNSVAQPVFEIGDVDDSDAEYYLISYRVKRSLAFSFVHTLIGGRLSHLREYVTTLDHEHSYLSEDDMAVYGQKYPPKIYATANKLQRARVFNDLRKLKIPATIPTPRQQKSHPVFAIAGILLSRWYHYSMSLDEFETVVPDIDVQDLLLSSNIFSFHPATSTVTFQSPRVRETLRSLLQIKQAPFPEESKQRYSRYLENKTAFRQGDFFSDSPKYTNLVHGWRDQLVKQQQDQERAKEFVKMKEHMDQTGQLPQQQEEDEDEDDED